MNKHELAAILNGRLIGNEITTSEAAIAKQAGLVVVFGYSDDNMELRGAIDDEMSCFDGGTAWVDRIGLLDRGQIDDGDDEAVAAYVGRKKNARQINALWCAESEEHPNLAWTYSTEIPHATFDVIEDGSVWCRGIVFAIEDLPAVA